jgi:hypothetical protein
MKVRSIETRHCDAGWRNYYSFPTLSFSVRVVNLEERRGRHSCSPAPGLAV